LFLRIREDAGSDDLYIQVCPYDLYVYTYGPVYRDRNQCHPVGMGKVKLQTAVPAFPGQSRFSVGAVVKLQTLWRGVKITSQDLAQGSPAYDKGLPLFRIVNPNRTLQFALREFGSQLRNVAL